MPSEVGSVNVKSETREGIGLDDPSIRRHYGITTTKRHHLHTQSTRSNLTASTMMTPLAAFVTLTRRGF